MCCLLCLIPKKVIQVFFLIMLILVFVSLLTPDLHLPLFLAGLRDWNA